MSNKRRKSQVPFPLPDRRENKFTSLAEKICQSPTIPDDEPPTFNSTFPNSNVKLKTISELNELAEKKHKKIERKKTGAVKFKSDCFGPKAKSHILLSKLDCFEDIPLEAENSLIMNKIAGLIKKKRAENDRIEENSCSELQEESFSEGEEKEDEEDKEKKPHKNISLKSFYDTDSVHAAKYEDEFWRYERDEHILNTHYKEIFGIPIEEKLESEIDENELKKLEKMEKLEYGENENKLGISQNERKEERRMSKSLLKSSKKDWTPGASKNDNSPKIVGFKKGVLIKEYKVNGKPKNLFKSDKH